MLVITAASLAACVATSVSPARNVPREVAGTYEVAVCRSAPCAPADSASAYASFTVVLYDSIAAARLDMPRASQSAVPATGCFVRGQRRRDPPDSYAGMSGREYIVWTADSGAVGFALFQSPHAGYVVRLRPTVGGLAGTGTSYGFELFEPRRIFPRDTVVAIRVGPPDRLYCHAPRR